MLSRIICSYFIWCAVATRVRTSYHARQHADDDEQDQPIPPWVVHSFFAFLFTNDRESGSQQGISHSLLGAVSVRLRAGKHCNQLYGIGKT